MPEPTRQPEHTARLDEWVADKGFGWLRWGEKRIFVHQRDIEPRHHQPNPGDVFDFVLGKDAQGRVCAKRAQNRSAVGKGGLAPLLLSPVLLVLPVFALHQAGVRLWVIACGATLVSTVTYGSYAIDKRRARTGAWRLSEAFLHLLELLGGWPGAWLAQQRLRHKCSKSSYQFVFWLIISIHQFAALDWLQHGRWSQMLISKATMVLKG